MVKMTSRLVLTTSKHFIFAPDMYYEPAAADTHTYSKGGRRSESLNMNTEFEIVSSKWITNMSWADLAFRDLDEYVILKETGFFSLSRLDNF